jgi:adenylosuccinate synthase
VPELQQLDVEAQVSSLTETLNFLRPFIVDGVHALNNVVGKKRILFEGAQATLLDVDLGTYPFVTSSNASVAGLCAGTGIAPKHIHRVLGICKAYTTRVGEGPFPTELFDEHGTSLRNAGQEYGTTTGRPRRCGWLDLVALKHAVTVNGVDRLALMKLDVLNAFESISVCTAYRYQGKRLEAFPASSSVLEKVQPEYLSVAGWQQDLSHAGHLADLPKNCQEYLSLIEHYLKVPIGVISIGPDRRQTILRAL